MQAAGLGSIFQDITHQGQLHQTLRIGKWKNSLLPTWSIYHVYSVVLNKWLSFRRLKKNEDDY